MEGSEKRSMTTSKKSFITSRDLELPLTFLFDILKVDLKIQFNISIQKNSFYVFVAELVNIMYSILVKIPVYQSFFLFGAELFFFMITAKSGGTYLFVIY